MNAPGSSSPQMVHAPATARGDMATDLDAITDHITAHPMGTVVLTGAGVSLASGIPTFREVGGLWDRYDPLEYGHIEAFRQDPEKVWQMLFEVDAVIAAARPNDAHHAIAQLERRGVVDRVLTQNGDGLHQRAGSRRVVELHGSSRALVCLTCAWRCGRDECDDALRDRRPPRCMGCAAVLKPDAVFFGEQLPVAALAEAHRAVRESATLLVVGTSAEVYPVAGLPGLASRTGAWVVEVNPAPDLPTHHQLAGRAEEILPQLVERMPAA